MANTIAVAGKGGVGKTTISGLLVRYLVEKGMTPVLAVDADPNSNLNEVLGLELCGTLGDAREEMKSGRSQGMTKDIFIEMKVNQCLVEETGFDLIPMGRPEGAGCYCAANNLLTASMDRLADNYAWLVVDNEAGLEHLSRVTTQKADLFIFISDPSRRGLTAAIRAAELARELKINHGPSHLIFSMVRDTPPQALLDMAAEGGMEYAGFVPDDAELARWDLEGRPTGTLPLDNPAVSAAYGIFNNLIQS